MSKLCWEDCGKCEVLVDKKLSCGHIKKNIKCCDDPPKICEQLPSPQLSSVSVFLYVPASVRLLEDFLESLL